MNKIKNGDVYSFEIDNMFGLVQIISKSDYGYKVRVFEKPVLKVKSESSTHSVCSTFANK